jgi:hypothetical protein
MEIREDAVFCISNSPQKRHPERSASQIYRATQHLMARSRRTPRVLVLPMPLGAFQPRSPHLADSPRSFPGAENKSGIRTIHPEFKDFAQTWGLQCMKRCARDHPVGSAARSCSRASVVEKLRAAWARQAAPGSFDSAPSSTVSRDRSVTRSAQSL